MSKNTQTNSAHEEQGALPASHESATDATASELSKQASAGGQKPSKKKAQQQKQKKKGNRVNAQAQPGSQMKIAGAGDRSEADILQQEQFTKPTATEYGGKGPDASSSIFVIKDSMANSSKSQGHPRRRRHHKQSHQGNSFVHNQLVNRKEFRVFYGLIATRDDVASPFNHFKDQKHSRQQKKRSNDAQDQLDKKFTANINSYNQPKDAQVSMTESGQAKPTEFEQLKEWFAQLSVDERVNALTTTSPYLAQILINMKGLVHKLGPTLFAQHLTVSQAAHASHAARAAGSLGQNMLYGGYLASQYKYNFMHPHYKYGAGPLALSAFPSPELFAYGYHEAAQAEQASIQPSQSVADFSFSDFFYQRQQCVSEVEHLAKKEPAKYEAQQVLVENLRFCDLLMYLDTITVSQKLIADSSFFFDILARVTDDKAFQMPCKFQSEQRPNSSSTFLCIETPAYFKADRFSSFAEWIAVILEENLWANFNYWKAKTGAVSSISGLISVKKAPSEGPGSKSDSQKISIQSLQNLFELKDIEEQFGFTVPSHKVHTLANSWINAPLQKKKGIIETLKSIVVDRSIPKPSQSLSEKGVLLQLRTADPERSSSSTSGLAPTPTQRAVNIHLQNQRFDSQQQTLLIERDEFEQIEKTSLSVHNPFAATDPSSYSNVQGKLSQSQSKKTKGQRGGHGDGKGSRSAVLPESAEDHSAQQTQTTQQINIEIIKEKGGKKEGNKDEEEEKASEREDRGTQGIGSGLAVESVGEQRGDEKANSNYQYALNFILFLLQTTLDRIETGKDFICRCFFKLIQQMHQDQVINELLSNQDGVGEGVGGGSRKQGGQQGRNQSAVLMRGGQLGGKQIGDGDDASGRPSPSKAAKNKMKRRAKAKSSILSKVDVNTGAGLQPLDQDLEREQSVVGRDEQPDGSTAVVEDPSDSFHASSPGQLAEKSKKIADLSSQKKLERDEKMQDDDVSSDKGDDEVDEEQQTPDFADVEVKIVEPTALKPHTAQAAQENPEQSLSGTFGVPASAEKSNDAKNTHNSQNVNLIQKNNELNSLPDQSNQPSSDKIRPTQEQLLNNQIINQQNMNAERLAQSEAHNNEDSFNNSNQQSTGRPRQATGKGQQAHPITQQESPSKPKEGKVASNADGGCGFAEQMSSSSGKTSQILAAGQIATSQTPSGNAAHLAKEPAKGKHSKKNKQKKNNQQKDELTSHNPSTPSKDDDGQLGTNAHRKDTAQEMVAFDASFSKVSPVQQRRKGGAQGLTTAKGAATTTATRQMKAQGRYVEEEKVADEAAGAEEVEQNDMANEDEKRSAERRFEDEVVEEYTGTELMEESIVSTACELSPEHQAGESRKRKASSKQQQPWESFAVPTDGQTALEERQGSSRKQRRKRAQAEKDDAGRLQNPSNADTSDDFGQNVATALAEASSSTERLYHDEDLVRRQGSSQLLFASQQQTEDGHDLEEASSRSDGVEEARSSPSPTGQGSASRAREAGRDANSGKTGPSGKEGTSLVTTASGFEIGQQRSQLIQKKKLRDRTAFQSFGMQSAQSDAQFVDAIDGSDPAADGDTVKATALLHTPPSGRSQNDNCQLSAQAAVPLKDHHGVEGEALEGEEDASDRFYAQAPGQEADPGARQPGAENETTSTEYISNLAEKLEAGQQKSGGGEIGHQVSGAMTQGTADGRNTQGASALSQSVTASAPDDPAATRTTTKKQKKKKKGKEQAQPLLKTKSEELLAPEATSQVATATDAGRDSAQQAAADATLHQAVTSKTGEQESVGVRDSDAGTVSTANTKGKQKKAKNAGSNAQQKRGGKQANQASNDPLAEAPAAAGGAIQETSGSARGNTQETTAQADGQLQEADAKQPSTNNKKPSKAAKAEKEHDQGKQRDSESLLTLSLSKNQSVPVLASKKTGKSVSMLDPNTQGNRVTEKGHDQEHHESQNPFEVASVASSACEPPQDLGCKSESKPELSNSAQTAGEDAQQTRTRRRRKKQRPGVLAHQDAMNQFIKETHKDQNSSRFSNSTTDYHLPKGGAKQHGNKNMGKKNYTKDSYHGKDGTSVGGQGTFGGQRDSQLGLTQKKAQSYIQGQQSTGQAQGQGSKIHASQIFSGSGDLLQVPPLPVYAKKNQSQIQLSPSTGAQKKKSGKDGSVFGGEGEEPGSGRVAGTKDSSRKDTDGASAQGLPARRTSTKHYFATYYQEKPADATMPEATYASSTTQALPYEPLPLAPQFSSTQSGQQKGKRKVAKGGHGSGYVVHTASGKYGRAEGPPQPAMTEAEQRAATKKEIIEAFEIQNTQQNRLSFSGLGSKKSKAAQNQSQSSFQQELSRSQEKSGQQDQQTSSEVAQDAQLSGRQANEPQSPLGTQQSQGELTGRSQRWRKNEGTDKVVAEGQATGGSPGKLLQTSPPFQPAASSHQAYPPISMRQPPLPLPPGGGLPDRTSHPFYMQPQNSQRAAAQDQNSLDQYHGPHPTSSFLQQSPRLQAPENAMAQSVMGTGGFAAGDGQDSNTMNSMQGQDLYPGHDRQPPGREADEAAQGRESCPLPSALPSAEKSKSQLLPGPSLQPTQSQGRNSVVHHTHHGHQPDLQQPGQQPAAQFHQSMGQQHPYHSSSMMLQGSSNELILGSYPMRSSEPPYRQPPAQFAYPDQQLGTGGRNMKKFKQKKQEQVPRGMGAPTAQPYFQQEDPYTFAPASDHIQKEGMVVDEAGLQQHGYGFGGGAPKRQSDLSYPTLSAPYKGKDKPPLPDAGTGTAHSHPQPMAAGAYPQQQAYQAQAAPQIQGGTIGYGQQSPSAQMFVPKQHPILQGQHMQAHQGYHQRHGQAAGSTGTPQEDLLSKGMPPVQSEPCVEMGQRRISMPSMGSGLMDSNEASSMMLNQSEGNAMMNEKKQQKPDMAGTTLPPPQPSHHYQNPNDRLPQPQMQGQSNSPQQNFMITSSFGQVGQVQGQIGQINQVNQYNINQYPSLNISSIPGSNFGPGPAGSPSANGTCGIQPMAPNFYMPVQGITNQFNQGLGCLPQQKMYPAHAQPPSIPTNLLSTLQALSQPQATPSQNLQQQQYMTMMAAANSPSQLHQMGGGVKYPHHYYDQNLPQTIEHKFYEKFDNDIYDEVNKIQHQLDLTKDERNYVLQKLQAFCKQVFVADVQEEATGASADGSNRHDEVVEAGTGASVKTQGKHHSTPSPKKAGKMDNRRRRRQQSPKIKQFGSLVTGLALESSDMDMAVTNLDLPDREKMIESLGVFADCLRKWEMIQDLNAISTASIPVIKAIVDLNQLREKEMNHLEDQQENEQQMQADSKDFGQTQNNVRVHCIQQSMNQANPQQMSKHNKKAKKVPEAMAKLKIDITFDDNMSQAGEEEYEIGRLLNPGFTPPHYYLTKQGSGISYGGIIEQKTHLGIASCKLIKHYVENYKCLKEVSIVLKQFLARMGLNSPYHGGLSSYSTVLLLVAYMNKWNLKMSPTLTPSRLLMGFLDYYSYYFSVSLFGIDVSNNGSFYEHGSPESNFVILDPLNENNNTTKNSFLTHEIIKSFRKAFNKLKSLLLQYQQQQNLNIADNLLDSILERESEPQPEVSSDVQTQTTPVQIVQDDGGHEAPKQSIPTVDKAERAMGDAEPPQEGQNETNTFTASAEERRAEGGVASSGDYDSNQSASNKQTQQTQTEEQIIPNASINSSPEKQKAINEEQQSSPNQEPQTSSTDQQLTSHQLQANPIQKEVNYEYQQKRA